MSVIAVDLGATKLATAVFSEDGVILHRDVCQLDGRTGRDVGALILDRIRAAVSHASRGSADAAARPTAVGVCVPGLYRETGNVWAPNIPGWEDYPLGDELTRALGADIVVAIDSDRSAYILGEAWRGAANGARDAIYLAVGTGIGAGILCDGRIVRGRDGTAGAIGWLTMTPAYRAEYERCGHFEYHASGPGLVNVARELMDADPAYTGALRHVAASELTTSALFEAFDRNDVLARRVIDEAVELWGMATANLVSLFDPEVIVFGGGVFGPATRFLDRIRQEAARWAQPIAMRRVKLVPTMLGNDAGLFGAARLGLLAAAQQPMTSARLRTTPHKGTPSIPLPPMPS